MSTSATLSDPQSMPLDQLKQAAFPTSDPPAAPAPAVEPTAPASPASPTPPPAEPYQVQAQQDGSFYVKLDTGEEFRGKPEEILPKIAKSKYDSSSYAKTLKAQLDAKPAVVEPTQPAPPAPPAEDPADAAARQWMVETILKDPKAAQQLVAAALGLPPEKLPVIVNSSEQMAVNATLADFFQICPDYVATKENNAVLMSYFPENFDHYPTAAELKQAYATALYEGKLQRQAAPAPTTPTAPPPMPGSVSSVPGGQNPWQMDMAALKQAANQK